MDKKGFVLVVCMFVLSIMMIFAVSLCAMCGTNLQIAQNHRSANRARFCAESGLEITRCWMANDVNSFAGIRHTLNTEKDESFTVEIELTEDANSLSAAITGRAGKFERSISGNFVFDANSWKFDQSSYQEF